MGTLFFFLSFFWFLILIVDFIRGKFLHKGKAKRSNILISHSAIVICLFFTGVFVVSPDPISFADYRFSTVSLNVRSGPSTGADIIEPQLEPGEKVFVLQDSAGWLAISRSEYDSTLSGWVAKSYTLPITNFSIWKARQDSTEKAQENKEKLKQERIAHKEALREKYGTEAFIESKKYVKRYIRSPKTADFPLVDFQSEHIYDNVFVIRSYVVTDNIFGGTEELNYTARLSKEKGEWVLKGLIINGEFVYKE